MNEEPPKAKEGEKPVNSEQNRKCSICGKLLSMYNKTNECHSHSALIELWVEPVESIMPQADSSNPIAPRGRSIPPKKLGND